MKIAVTGSSGLIGTALVGHLHAEGHTVLRLVRRAPRTPDEIAWDPRLSRRGEGAIAPQALPAVEGIDAAVNLAGAPVAGRRWNAAVKSEIRASRVEGTKVLAAALAGLQRRPAALLSASGAGWYGATGDTAVDESGPPGAGFLAEVARDWEKATGVAANAGIRVVHLRTGIVLSKTGGMLGRLLPLFRLGLGARLGPGAQFTSWIALADVMGAIEFLLGRTDMAGPVNLTAPNPVTNAEFTSALAAAVGRPAFLRLPSAVLDIALGEAASELLTSARVLPGRLTEAGFGFRHPDIQSALSAELRAS